MIALPIFLQMTLEYNAMETGLTLAPLSLSMFGVALLAGRKAGERRPSNIVLLGFALSAVGMALIIPIVPRTDSGWALVDPVADHGLGPRSARLAAEQLHPLPDRGGAGERGSRGELGGRLVRALVRTRDGRRHHARLPRLRVHQPHRGEQGDPSGPAAADRGHARGRRRGDEQRAARTASRRASPTTSRPRFSASTSRRETAPFRSRCSSR